MTMMSLTACASCSIEKNEPINDDPITEKPNPQPNPEYPTDNKGKVLIAYFSCTNTTKGIGESIAELTGGELYRIEPQTPYSAADLDYNSDCRANREQNDPTARPGIMRGCENLVDYDVVFLGYPIWWGEAPRIISTFIESGDFKGKTIIPFCTSHSSGIGSSDRNLHPLAPEAEWIAGRRFRGNEAKDDIENWISDIGISFNQDNDTGNAKYPLSKTGCNNTP